MSVQPSQKIAGISLPAITVAKPGVMPVDNGAPLMTSMQIGGGTVTINGATPVTVVDARVTENSIIVFTLKTLGGTQGATPAATPTAGVGFDVYGTALDTSTYNYGIFG